MHRSQKEAKILQLKNKIIEIKNSLETLTGRFEQAEEIISELKHQAMKITKEYVEQEKKIKE